MLRRPRRLATSALPLLLASLVGLSACGEEPDPGGALKGFEAFSISGEPGTEPEVTWKGEMEAGDLESKTLVEGDGAAVADGDQVIVNYWVGNGFTQQKTYATYDDQPSGQLIKVSKDFQPAFLAGIQGQRVGSRVAVIASAEAAFGELGSPQLGIGNKDSVLLVMDLTSGVLEKPEGERTPPPAWVPGLLQEKAEPARFGFTQTPEPTDELRVATLITGDGPAIEEGSLAVVDYLGQVYGAEEPFDESYTKEPFSAGIGVKPPGVIKGWDQALQGVTVGSRVILSIPPDLGYGEEGNKQAGIKGTDTLFFIIDVLATG